MKRHGQVWSRKEIAQLRQMRARGDKTARIARVLQRSISSVYQKASQTGISRR